MVGEFLRGDEAVVERCCAFDMNASYVWGSGPETAEFAYLRGLPVSPVPTSQLLFYHTASNSQLTQALAPLSCSSGSS